MTAEQYNTIVAYLRRLLEGSPWEGHVFGVGGCCRDIAMGRPINDIDLAVDTPNGGIGLARWMHEKGVTTGRPTEFQRYGTAMLELRKFPGVEIELVQTRKANYPRNRPDADPADVFGTVEEDAWRRDLTVNTLFHDISTGNMLDPTGMALADIESQTLRTPLSPADTLGDDPVRALRALRMAAALDWTLDDALLKEIKNAAQRLGDISVERVRAEFEKMITGADPRRAVKLLMTTGVLGRIVPELGKLYARKGDGRKTMDLSLHTLERLGRKATVAQAWAALLWPLHVTDKVQGSRSKVQEKDGHKRRIFPVYERVLRRLHHHSKFVNAVGSLVTRASESPKWGVDSMQLKDRRLKGLQRNLVTPEKLRDTLAFIDAVNRTWPDRKDLTPQIPALRKRLKL